MVASIENLRRVPTFQGVGITAAKLIECLATLDTGDQRTDEQLAEVCGKPTSSGKEGYAALQTAIRYVRKHHGKVIERIWGANAVKCLNGGEVVDSGHVDMGR